jgi:hypothetical protein
MDQHSVDKEPLVVVVEVVAVLDGMEHTTQLEDTQSHMADSVVEGMAVGIGIHMEDDL